MKNIITFFIFCFLCVESKSDSVNFWKFKSELDSFRIDKVAGKFVIGNFEISPLEFEKLKEVFSKTLDYDGLCSTDSQLKPDLIVTAQTENSAEYREFYIEKKMIKNDKGQCIYLSTGDLNQLPLHRSWFIGEKNHSIKIENTLQVFQNNQLLLDFHKNGSEWNQKIENKHIRWEYFERVINSFEDFPINSRAHIDSGKDKPSFEIRTGREIYTFYLFGNHFWAIKIPKLKWLVLSSSWAVFENFDIQLWLNPYNNDLITLENTKNDFNKRKLALSAIGDSWDKSIKAIFHKIILESEEDENIKQIVVKKMRQRPTQESMKILAKGLDQTENYDLQIEMIKVLKLMNPKGPELNLKETEKADEVINYWQKWANDLK